MVSLNSYCDDYPYDQSLPTRVRFGSWMYQRVAEKKTLPKKRVKAGKYTVNVSGNPRQVQSVSVVVDKVRKQIAPPVNNSAAFFARSGI